MRKKTSKTKNKMQRPYKYYGKCINCVDGDTIDVELDLGFNLSFGLRLRLYGINAPEKRGVEREAGKRAQYWIEELILGEFIKIETRKDKTGKYGRMLATIYDQHNGMWRNINWLMVEQGHAIKVDY